MMKNVIFWYEKLFFCIFKQLRGGPFFAPEKCLKEFILTWSTLFENPILRQTISLRNLW